ncbi:MAG: hypothetical protein MUE41_17480 [Gemmatimonadaceae bacterium]|jgi:hypothetical protein|nr:hypothetical protein [Gemmatimonadaceae bacterium]
MSQPRARAVSPRPRTLAPFVAATLLVSGCVINPFDIGDDDFPRPGPPVEIRAATTSQLLEVGDSADAFVSATDARGTSLFDLPTIQWSVSDSAAATVTARPRGPNAAIAVIARRAGTITLTARLGALVSNATLPIIPALAPLELQPAALTLRAGDSSTVRLLVTDRDAGAPVPDLPVQWDQGGPATIRAIGYAATISVSPGTRPQNMFVAARVGRRSVLLPIRVVQP